MSTLAVTECAAEEENSEDATSHLYGVSDVVRDPARANVEVWVDPEKDPTGKILELNFRFLESNT